MGSIDRYILRTTISAFLLVLASLTGVIWITQALRGIDLMTSQGQTILVFLGFTSLAIPMLILIIAPLALVIAVAHTLNKLGTDSEIIVMNAAGMRPARLVRPFLIVALIVAAVEALIAAYLGPAGLRRVRNWDVEITADVVSNIIQPGQFSSVTKGLTLYIKERKPGGLLSGIFLDDRRNEKEHLTILAERGTILKNADGTFLVLDNGNLQRQDTRRRDPTLVSFERYAIDLSKFTSRLQKVQYSVRERYFWEFFNIDPTDQVYRINPGQFRAEFHDRIMAALYPIVFTIIAFAFLGPPRTTRQSRAASIGLAIMAITALRVVGFATTVFAARTFIAAPLQYVLLIAVSAGCFHLLLNGIVIELPAAWSEAINRMNQRLMRRFAPA